jgi:hypothetical protein
MAPVQQAALEGLVGRPLLPGEITQIDQHIGIRNDVAIAGLLSVGRKKVITRTITERGVRAALPVAIGSRFIVAIKAMQTTEPAWLAPLLAAMQVPAEDRQAYYETLSCAYGWLAQEAGLDIGSGKARDMLDLIAAGDPSQAPAVSVIKALAEIDDPIPFSIVSDALNKVEGRMTL